MIVKPMHIDVPLKWQSLAVLPQVLYTADQVRALDQAAINAGTSGSILMLRAARAVFEQLIFRWPQATSVIVFCGAGNNGGDGFLVAKLAAERGFDTTVVELADASRYSEDALLAYQQMLAAGVSPFTVEALNFEQLTHCDVSSMVIVDAMLGTGFQAEPRPLYKKAIETINQSKLSVLAVDIPSGVCCDTGRVSDGVAVIADITVTFIGLKQGLFTGDAVNYVGSIIFSDLGIGDFDTSHLDKSDAVLDDATTGLLAKNKTLITHLSQLDKLTENIPVRRTSAYKNQSGHVLVIGGDYGMNGAPLLAASAALRCGAGLVSVATRPEHIAGIIAHQPELMVRGVEQDDELLVMLERASTIVVGPGLGQSDWSLQLLKLCLAYVASKHSKNLPIVIDADALNLIAQQPSLLSNNITAVLTPHMGEAYRLLDAKQNTDEYYNKTNRFEVVRLLCEHYQQVTVLKGAGSLVANTQARYLCPYGNSVLATAGSGDVLSGLIAAFLAQKMSAIKAAELAVTVHAAAADLHVSKHGVVGFVASDLLQALPLLLNQLLASR